ncbi:uncharacterized protein LOC143035182 [Oratosquilla oratoria]|uniref:uncharacterized protein LOC143035182 n=1 Tax=Oratosquilla oratoria TaxID=337810 RepID=UPI003F761613
MFTYPPEVYQAYINFKEEICHTWLNFTQEELARLCHNYSEVIKSRKSLGSCTSMPQFLRLLEKQGLLSPYKVDILESVSRQNGTHTEMVKHQIQLYKKSLPSSEHLKCKCVITVPLVQEQSERRGSQMSKPLIEIYEYLSENLDSKWIDFGRNLPGMDECIDELVHSRGRKKEKLHDLLLEFVTNCSGDPIHHILGALLKAKCKRQFNYISRNWGAFQRN